MASFSHQISPFRAVDNLTDRGSLCTPIINITIIYHPDDHHPPPEAAGELSGRFDFVLSGSARTFREGRDQSRSPSN